MEYRPFGTTGIEVSEIGYGAWGIGKSQWIGADDDESVRALEHAIKLGVNFIDTARAYGDGHSERLVGQVVRATAERVYVATKVPPKNLLWPAPSGVHVDEAFPGEHIRRSTGRASPTSGSRRSTFSSSTCGRTTGSARATGSRRSRS